MNPRIQKIQDLIQRELSDLILREVKDPRVRLASVSQVAVAADLSHADVRISVLGDDEDQRGQALEGLRSAAGYLRRELGRRLRLKATPELHFELDRGAEHSQRIHEILDELHLGEEE